MLFLFAHEEVAILNSGSIILVLLGLPASWVLTGLVFRYTMSRGILDIPNHRSSHTVATPRGGGLAIVVTFLAGVLVLTELGIVPSRLGVAILGGGLLVAGIGWLDDKNGGLSALIRACVHVVAAVWAIYWLGGLPSLSLGFTHITIPPLWTCLATVGIVWSINLYNFMDGIDGIAGSEAVSVAVVGGVLTAASGAWDLAWLSWMLGLSCAGFLVWNWPPAKIFMGDVGSGFLGFMFAVMAIATENRGVVPLFAWILLLGVFVVDATATLIRRMLRGERWYEAHRSHAYQLVVRAGYSHKQTVVAVLAVNAVLSGLAVIVCMWPEHMVHVVLIAMGSLLAVYLSIQHRFMTSDLSRASMSS